METQPTRVSTILLCTGLVLVTAAFALGQERPGSVLNRLQTVDDPELGDLIRVAIDNYRRVYTSGPGSDEELKIVRDVTEAYARIKLLDRQIEQTQRRMEQTTGEVRQEMILAQAELESQRTMELANLRQIMRIMPAHAFGRRPVDQLKAWVVLDVLDANSVAVYEVRQPFNERRMYHSLVGVMPVSEAATYAVDQLSEKNRVPMRVDIQRTVAGLESSQRLEEHIVSAVKQLRLQMQAEIHLADAVRNLHSVFGFLVWRDQIGTGRSSRDGLSYLSGIIEPNEIAASVERWLSEPGRLPATFELAYDPASEATVDRLAQTVAQTAKRMNIRQLVEINRTISPLDPQTEYLGTWQAQVDDETIQLSFLPGQRVQATEIQAGRIARKIPGRWSLEDNRIVVTVDNEILTGKIDDGGHLVLEGGDEVISFEKKGD
ncbi:MAG: hypothetical protein JW993_11690 [Sedimentisphaerales bacterium]|nr:hypothetical protein [Sedimentisphaerales bacterium]